MAITYYGLSLNSGDLAGNPFINFCISGLTEMPGIVVTIWLIKRFGRIKPYSLFFFLGGLALIATLFVPSGR